jgi:hypothetical protein
MTIHANLETQAILAEQQADMTRAEKKERLLRRLIQGPATDHLFADFCGFMSMENGQRATRGILAKEPETQDEIALRDLQVGTIAATYALRLRAFAAAESWPDPDDAPQPSFFCEAMERWFASEAAPKIRLGSTMEHISIPDYLALEAPASTD